MQLHPPHCPTPLHYLTFVHFVLHHHLYTLTA
jgi:hypothetical protein